MSMKKETELAEVLVEYLKNNSWEVYQEVIINGRRLDILAIKDNVYWAIECKLTLNLDVMEQAENWLAYANMSSICVPSHNKKNRRKYLFAKKILENIGVGIFCIPKARINCYEYLKPKIQKDKRSSKLITVYEEQKTFTKAGGNGTFFTPFKKTCEEIRKFISKNPGSNVGHIVKNVKHHYSSNSSAKSSLSKLLTQNVIPGLYIIFDEDMKIKVYPKIDLS